MSPEEFDNRLRQSFRDEYVPPKDHLWVNISGKLDSGTKKPFWYWLLPVLFAAVSVLVWVGIGTGGKNSRLAVQEPATPTEATPAVSGGMTTPANQNLQIQEQARREMQPAYAENTAAAIAEKPAALQNPESPVRSPLFSRAIYSGNTNGKIPVRRAFQTLPTISNENEASAEDFFESLRTMNLSEFQLLHFTPDFSYAGLPVPLPVETISEDTSVLPPAPKSPKNKSMFDEEAKHKLVFGAGVVHGINITDINRDSQAWVHYHIWNNREKLTRNGGGFQLYANYAYAFGKKNRFVFETGLSYTRRSENIQINESSYDIPVRDSFDRIQRYVPVVLKFWVSGQRDTTYYQATYGPTLAVRNVYSVITVPFRLGTEHKLSASGSTYFATSLGGGLSMIQSRKSEHVDIITAKNVKESVQTLFTASLSGQLSLYTRFNDIGQIGVYTGYNMYLNSWQVNAGQYAIKMRDLQFGILFRKSL